MPLQRFIDGVLTALSGEQGREEPANLTEMGSQVLLSPEAYTEIKDDADKNLSIARELHQSLLDAGCLADWIYIEDWEAEKAEDYRPVVPPFGIRSWQRNAWGLRPMTAKELKEKAARLVT